MNKVIKILDIEFPRKAIKPTVIADNCRFGVSYITQLLRGDKDNKEALRILRDTIVKVYTNLIKINPSVSKDNHSENKTLLKKAG